MEISVSIQKHSLTQCEAQRVAHASGVLVSASRRNNLSLISANSEDDRIERKCAIARTRSPARETHAPPLPARGIVRLRFGSRGLKAKNCFAPLHQIKPIACNRFQISHVHLEQIDLARLTGEQTLLFVHLLLQVVDFRPALHQFLIRRSKQADDHKPDRYDEQHEKNPIQSPPDAGFTTRAEIAVSVIHLAQCSALHSFVTKFFFDSRPRDSRWQFDAGTHNHRR
jgi:hypothetical protein